MNVGDLVYYKGLVFSSDTDPPIFDRIDGFKIGLVIAKDKSSYLLSIGNQIVWTCSDETAVLKDWDIILVSKASVKKDGKKIC